MDRGRLTERLAALVRAPSENPPGEEEAAAWEAASQLAGMGLEVHRHEAEPGRPNLVARTGTGEGPTLTFCSHLDVVPAGDRALWTADPWGAEIADGRLSGRGSADAKGPVAAALEATAALLEAGATLHGTLELALVADEETMGSKGAGYLVAEGLMAPDMAIVGEPTSLRVVRGQRGVSWFRVTTRGRAAHGSAPERGVSAVRHMAEVVRRLEETLPDVDHPLLGGPTLSVGTIRGGAKVNVVPAECAIEVDRRTVPGETADSVLASVETALELVRERFPELDAEVELILAADPFELPADAPFVGRVTAAVSEALGHEAEVIGFRGASDARFLSEAGADVVVCGPGDIAVAHTANESLDLDELERAARAYAVTFARLLAPDDG